MAYQTIQDVKAIYAAAKAKFDSLPEENKFRVHCFFWQCMLVVSVTLIMVFAILGVQVYLTGEVAMEARREAVDYRSWFNRSNKEAQRLQKELDSK